MSALYHDSADRTTKKCAKCGVEKTFDQFYRANEKYLHSYCKQCDSVLKREYQKAHPSPKRTSPRTPPEGVVSKVCSGCHIDKPLDAFAKSNYGKYGVRAHCKECRLEEERQRRLSLGIKPRLMTPLPTKVCVKCSVEKTANDFYSRSNRCKKCTSAQRQIKNLQKRQLRLEQKPLFVFSRTCSTCNTEKPSECFSTRTSQCKDCVSLYNAQYRNANAGSKRKRDLEYYYENRETILNQRISYNATHQEQLRERRRNYRKKNPLKLLEYSRRHIARKKHAAIDEVDYQHILDRDGYWCYICEKDIDPLTKDEMAKLSFDHVIALACSGAHSEDNIKPAHKACNSRKQNRPLEKMTPFQRRGVN